MTVVCTLPLEAQVYTTRSMFVHRAASVVPSTLAVPGHRTLSSAFSSRAVAAQPEVLEYNVCPSPSCAASTQVLSMQQQAAALRGVEGEEAHAALGLGLYP
jgi:hypothetical protein